ncbi:hypothetical protein B0H10DRAFT_1961448 [Mycena sp. CBHHK59/15]|nr:hypothetical protein B0H10DRAFT_1961448 [Mycena sp. CBHHK59/15]
MTPSIYWQESFFSSGYFFDILIKLCDRASDCRRVFPAMATYQHTYGLYWSNCASDSVFVSSDLNVAAVRFRTASEPEPNPNRTPGANWFKPENFQGYLERIQR